MQHGKILLQQREGAKLSLGSEDDIVEVNIHNNSEKK